MIRDKALCTYDFQVLLDYSGNVYHLDLDRCLETGQAHLAENALVLDFLDDLKRPALAGATLKLG